MKPRFDCCKCCVPPKRSAGCHSVCKEYLDDKAQDEAEKELVRQIKAKDDDYARFKMDTVDAMRRRKFR